MGVYNNNTINKMMETTKKTRPLMKMKNVKTNTKKKMKKKKNNNTIMKKKTYAT